MATSRLVLLLFLTAQVWDGIFTYVAVQLYGLAAEGNVLLQTWMGVAGVVPTLVGAKLVAAACGTFLYACGVHHVLAGLTLLYAAGAIVPWLSVFG